MRMGLLLLSLALLVAPMPVGAAAPADGKVKPARVKLPTNLRGSLAPDAPPTKAAGTGFLVAPPVPGAPKTKSAVLSALPIPAPLEIFALPKPSESECRTGCAHDYYFCLSGSANTACSDTWGQCLSACSYPSPSLDR